MRRFLLALSLVLAMAGWGWGDYHGFKKWGLNLTIGGGGSPILSGFSYSKSSYADFVTSLSTTGCTVEDLGVSSDGVNNLYGLQVGACDGSKPVIMLTGCLHGSEWQNAYIIRQFMTYIADPTLAGASAGYFGALKSLYDFYAIPLANPYGYINNVGCNATIVGGKNVDLNRNFDYNWSAYSDAGDAYSKGASAASEPETQIIAGKMTTLMPILSIEGHLQLGADPTIYETPITFNTHWTALNATLVTLGIPSTVFSSTSFFPMMVNWSRTVLNTNIHRYSNAIIYELGSGSSDTVNAQYGLNILLQGCWKTISWMQGGYEESITIRVTDDTDIRSNVGDNNYGIYADSWVGLYGTPFTGRMLVKFDTTRIPAGSTVDSASLYLYCVNAYTSAYNDVSLHRSLVAWYEGLSNGAVPGAGEDASTWNNRNHNGAVAWGAAGGQSGVDYNAVASATTTIVKLAWNTFNVKADMQAIADATITDYGYFVIGDEVHGSTAHDFANREYNATNDPYLAVVIK